MNNEIKFKKYILKKMYAKDLPLWQLDLSEMYELYPTFKDWLKYSIYDKQSIACFYNNELVGYLIYNKMKNFKYIRVIDENIDNLDVYKMCSIFVDAKHRNSEIGSQMLYLFKQIEQPDYIYCTNNYKCACNFLHKNNFYQIPNVKHISTGDFVFLHKTGYEIFKKGDKFQWLK
jgi:hypothetical protein